MRGFKSLLLVAVPLLTWAPLHSSAEGPAVDPDGLAAAVTIYRDAYGTPHIDGPTDAAVLFGLAYAQAEDNFWQVEDNYILSLGRYCEVHGIRGLNSDLLNRAFEIVPRSREDYEARAVPEDRRLCEAYTAGLNYFLAKNPQVKPRLIERFEPWHVLAYARHIALELCFRYTRLNNSIVPRTNSLIWTASGSNAWAIAPAQTRDGKALLLVNPHLPQFGFAQFYEAHLRSGEGINFTGAMFFGNPLPSLGHNEHLGWALTTNEPDIADVWRVTFDDPQHPLQYRYDGGHRTATEWNDTIRIRWPYRTVERTFTFRKTHHGPIVAREDEQHFLAARVSDLYELRPLRQALEMIKSRNLGEFRQAISKLQLPYMNYIYADREGNILYLYGGLIPRRDPLCNWRKPVDGADPRCEWQGFHPIDDLPQLLNPRAGYIQNCNSCPFKTTGLDNPDPAAFPAYMVEDRDDDRRRAKRSREMIEARSDWTFDDVQQAAFDTTLYWAKHDMPSIGEAMDDLRRQDPQRAEQVAPLWEHLREWDGRITADSTAATLATAWYDELYEPAYPSETFRPQYAEDPAARLVALLVAADKLENRFGDWQIPWGEVHRMQRRPRMTDILVMPFSDEAESVPSVGGHGPMGVILTEYYSPVLNMPLLSAARKHYGLVGTSYLAVYEFGPQVRGASVVTFGTSADPDSPHFFDQARLIEQSRLKPELFQWNDVLSGAEETYHPGQRARKLSK